MSIFECDEEKIIRAIREDEFEQGVEKGRLEGRLEGRNEGEVMGRIFGKAESILDLLIECGEIPEELRQTILQESNPEIIKRWLKLAAKVESVEEFITMKD